MRLTLRQLELFCAVAQAGSTTAAADAVGLSQSAISAALNELESALDARLFDRAGRRLMLNEAGRSLLTQAQALLERARAIEDSFRQSDSELPTTLRVAASTTIGNHLMPGIIAAFCGTRRHVGMELWIGNTQDVCGRVARYEADLGLIEGPCHVPGLEVADWCSDELIVIAAPTHELAVRAQHAPLSVRDLRAADWLLREPGSGTREAVEDCLLPHLRTIRARLILGSSEAIKEAVANGAGISCLPRLLVEDMLAAGRLRMLPTALPPMRRSFLLVSRRESALSPMLQQFIDETTQVRPDFFPLRYIQ